MDFPQLKLECLNCQRSDIWTNSPCCNVLLRTSFCFLQDLQYKRVRTVSTNNITYPKQIYKPFLQKPSHIMFLTKKRRLADAQCWTVTLSNWIKQPPEVFYKNAFLKIFAIFTRKHPCEVFKNNYFEENFCMAASEITLQSDCLELCFWIAFKTIL